LAARVAPRRLRDHRALPTYCEGRRGRSNTARAPIRASELPPKTRRPAPWSIDERLIVTARYTRCCVKAG